MKQFISRQKARKLVPSILGWAKVRQGYEWPVGGVYSKKWVGHAGGGLYYIVEKGV